MTLLFHPRNLEAIAPLVKSPSPHCTASWERIMTHLCTTNENGLLNFLVSCLAFVILRSLTLFHNLNVSECPTIAGRVTMTERIVYLSGRSCCTSHMDCITVHSCFSHH